jgi:drug/metabolite transporter (DMT)-like permease
MTTTLGYILMVLVSIAATFGQICFKKVAGTKATFYQKIRQPLFILGCILFVACAITSSFVAKVLDFTILYAGTSLNFVFILFFSKIILHEEIDWPKIVGVLVIILGLITMASY